MLIAKPGTKFRRWVYLLKNIRAPNNAAQSELSESYFPIRGFLEGIAILFDQEDRTGRWRLSHIK